MAIANRFRAMTVLLVALAAVGCDGGQGAAQTATGTAPEARAVPATTASGETGQLPELGLFTTLPLVWGESADIAGLLDDSTPTDPARLALERRYRLAPLDVLDSAQIAPLSRLLLVQPRVLGPAENVALDTWVRAGGSAVIFADPLLTRHTIFPIGDKRRPQDVALLSPILARWGLALEDRDEGEGVQEAEILGERLPVRHPGRLVTVTHDAPAECRIESQGLVARCTIGKGRVTIVADAAAFDDLDHAEGQAETLVRTIAKAFAG